MSVHIGPSGPLVRWRQGSMQKSRTFRWDEFESKADAREAANDFDRSLKRQKRMGGIDPLANERDFRTVVEEWWRAHHATLAKRTRVDQRSYLENRILPRFEGYRLCDLTTPEVEQFRVELVEAEVGEPTQRKILYVLSGVFTYAERMGYIPPHGNPIRAIKKPGAYRQRLIQPFPPEKVEEIRGWFLERDDLAGATMVSVLAYSGPRPEEAHARLTWADVGRDTIIYRGEKTRKDRTTRLLSPLAHDLKVWRRESGVAVGQVFGWTNSRFNNWRRKRFHKATETAGIDLTRPYDLRHAFASLLAGQGASTKEIADELGHSKATCERWYSHLEHEEAGSAEERIWAARNLSQKDTRKLKGL